jgi:Dimerisation2-like domain/O-methyltransferase domain
LIKYDRPASLTAFEAISVAQRLAFAPIAFQATATLLELGILKAVAEAGEAGACAADVSSDLGLSEYGVHVLLDMGLSVGLVWRRDDRYVLDKVGHFLLNDKMTRTNFDFVRDVCYSPMQDLTRSVEGRRPAGLERFGDWPTLYPGLTSLPEPARSSWFAFDHFYSQKAFSKALDIVFARAPRRLLDIGGNTGIWALECFRRDAAVRVTVVDLPEQTWVARERVAAAGASARIDTYDVDLLDPEQRLPAGADAIWMSQFLDCFSPEQIVAILQRAREGMDDDCSLYVLELLWDRQEHEAAAFSLNATSLYFTCIANGVSRMYRSDDLLRLVEESGLVVREQHDGLGVGHTLLRCTR